MAKKIKESLLVNKELLDFELKVIENKWGQSARAWIGWCKTCKAFRVHACPVSISYESPTCSLGHKSEGKSVRELSRVVKRIK